MLEWKQKKDAKKQSLLQNRNAICENCKNHTLSLLLHIPPFDHIYFSWVSKSTVTNILYTITLYRGVDPDREISAAEIDKARQEIGYMSGARNIVIAGNLNGGKSSLLNALRDVRFGDEAYAPTGTAETTMDIGCYVDARPHGYHVWYDTPGAGTTKFTGWGYYYNQKLFIYDTIILVHDSSLTQVCPVMS